MSIKIIVTKLYPERADAIAKKLGLKGSTDKGFTPASEWEMQRVRAYLAGEISNVPGVGTQGGVIRLYKNWEELEEIIDMRTGKPFRVKFDPTKVLPLGDGKLKLGKNEILRAIPLNRPMIEWVAKGVAFSKEAVKQLNAVKGLPKQFEGAESQSDSVSKFLSIYLQAEARERAVRDEIEELDKEKD